jgi:hypothetical protein
VLQAIRRSEVQVTDLVAPERAISFGPYLLPARRLLHTKQPFSLPRSVPQFAFRDKNRLFRARDRWFESISLQPGVMCELLACLAEFGPRLSARVCEAGLGAG